LSVSSKSSGSSFDSSSVSDSDSESCLLKSEFLLVSGSETFWLQKQVD